MVQPWQALALLRWLVLLSSSLELVKGTSSEAQRAASICPNQSAEGDAPELLQTYQAPKSGDLVVDVLGSGPEKWPRESPDDVQEPKSFDTTALESDEPEDQDEQDEDEDEDEDENDGGSSPPQDAESCDSVSWPCYDNVACHWPLQQINTKSGCSTGKGRANISSLNLDDGTYTTLCYLEGVCLNACSVSPIHSAIFCRAQGNFEGQQFVRVSCPLGDLKEPVKGSLCYYGEIGSTFAGSFDLEFGTYYWKEIDGSKGLIYKLDADEISGFTGSTTAVVNPTLGWNQVKLAQTFVVQQNALKSIADFVIAAGDLIPGGRATDRFLVGCHGNRVYVQNVNFTGSAPATASYRMVGSNPQKASGAQWFFKGEIYCAYNEKEYGVYFINVSSIDLFDGTIEAGYVSESQETNSNDGMNCLNATSPFPPAIITTTTTTTSTTTKSTTLATTTIARVQCPRGQADWSPGDAAGGSLKVGQEIAPGVVLADFRPGGNPECTNAAIFTPENGGDGEDEGNLKQCACNLIVAQKNGPNGNGTVNVCSPSTARAEVVLQFDNPQKIRGFEMWNTAATDLTTQFRWENDQIGSGVITVPPSQKGAGTGFVDISEVEPLARNVKKVAFDFGGPAGLKSIRFCKQDGSVVGDPHVHTLDGKTYVLLQQGTFLMWRFSGFETEFPSSNIEEGNKKAQVDWRIFVHYSGKKSYTKGLLLLDNSMGMQRQALELTSEKCSWRKRRMGNDGWSHLDQPQMLSVLTDPGSEFVTGFNVVWNKEEKDVVKHVRFVMNTKRGTRVLATLHVSCQPGHHINARIDMDQLGYEKFVQGEVGLARSRPLPELQHSRVGRSDTVDLLSNVAGEGAVRTDQQFKSEFQWSELGGSPLAADYLSTVDEEGVGQVSPCNAEEEIRARAICAKHFQGPENDFFSDCVFDVCAGGGEVSALLLAAVA